MTPEQMQARIVRYGELRPCRTAFIDAHTPGSDQKENFTIIGGGVSESPDQHVHIAIPHGFNIGAAGQPPKCRNSLHSHRTAEVFFVLSGRWRFFWGRWGTTGEVVLEEGDIINIDIPQRTINVDVEDAEFEKRRIAMEAKGDKAWQPVDRDRQVSAALKVYASMATSADKGAVRDLSKL